MIASICNQLLQNKIGIIEHDTLPGIVGIASDENAKKIIALKKRAEHKGLIVLIPDLSFLDQMTQTILPSTQTIIQQHWPGPLTIIFKKKPCVSSIISGHPLTIAIRYPKHPLLNTILNTLQKPLLSTSANLSGQTTCCDTLVKSVDFVYGNINATRLESASTIIDGTLNPPNVIRQGTIQIQ